MFESFTVEIKDSRILKLGWIPFIKEYQPLEIVQEKVQYACEMGLLNNAEEVRIIDKNGKIMYYENIEVMRKAKEIRI